MAAETPDEFSTFEVTLPKGVNHHTLALYGLGSALGWNITERNTLASDLDRGAIPEYLEVTPRDLNNISAELWGTEIYGQSATNFLQDEKERLQRSMAFTYQLSGTEITVDSELHYFYGAPVAAMNHTMGTYPSHLRSQGQAETDRIQEMFARLWPLTPFPFEAPTVKRSPSPPQVDGVIDTWELEPGPLSRVRLAHHARTSGKATHTLRGSVGKALDVINIAAGLTSKNFVASKPVEPDLEFIDYQQFKEKLKNSGLKQHAQKEIRQRIRYDLEDQIRRGRTGLADRQSEMIVEGKIEWVSHGQNRVPGPERIATISLAHLFDNFPSTNYVAGRQFLAQFAA